LDEVHYELTRRYEENAGTYTGAGIYALMWRKAIS
jgi:hypothetical protein